MRFEASRISKPTMFAARIVVQDYARLILIALCYRLVAQQYAKDVHFGIVYHPHSALQYFSILLVR